MTNERHIDNAADAQRIDKWLWHARVVKTRTLAAKLAIAGTMRINGHHVTRASQTVRVGDVLTFVIGERVKVYRVAGFTLRRGSSETARTLYEDLSPPPPDPASKPLGTPAAEAGGRPTKKARRALDRITRDWSE